MRNAHALLAAALAVPLLLAACTPLLRPEGPAVTSPRIEADAIVAADGARLPLRKWLPAGTPRTVILGLHGFNDYSRAFARPAPALAERGIAVYAYDQRGFGGAPNRGDWAGTPTMADDMDAAVRLLEARYPGVPLYVLGESMGGAVAMVALTRPGAPPVAGLILAAPAVWSRDDMGLLPRVALWLGTHVFPWLPVSGGDLDIMPSDNIAMLRELSRDPLVIKESRADTVAGLVDLMDAARRAAPRLKVPLLYLAGARDEVVPPAATRKTMRLLPGRPTLAVYPHGYHMLLRDKEARTVLDDIAAWIADRRRPLPSGADRLTQAQR